MIYQNLIIEDTNESATEKELLALQGELGCEIPDDYKEFLLACNGGYLEYDLLVEFEDGNTEWMSYSSLYKLDASDDWESNPFEMHQERKKEGFPQKQVFPIARDGGGSVLYIDLRDGYKVVAFVEGLPGWAGLRQENSLVVVAESFNDYLSKLTLSDETIEYHINNFDVSEASALATVEWLDSVRGDWRHIFKEEWNSRVSFMQV